MLRTRSSNRRPFEFRVTATQKHRCRELASAEGVSMSELIRRAVTQYAERQDFERNLGAFLATTGLASEAHQG